MTNSSPKILGGKSVALISHGFQPAYERDFCNALADNGVFVTLYGSSRTDTRSIRNCVRVLNVRGSQDPGRSKAKKALNLLRYHLLLLLRVATERPANIHLVGLTNFVFLTGILEGLVFRILGRRYIQTVHNVLPHDAHTWRNRVLYRIPYSVPHLLVVHTDLMKETLSRNYLVPNAKIVVMQHGCIPPPPNLPQNLEPRNGERIRLLFFGGVAPYKGLDILVQAFSEVPAHFELNIVGHCRSERLADELTCQIASSASRDRMHWCNEFVSEEAMNQAFLRADILVLPYRHIDQSGVLFQALRFGLPVVATDVGEFSRIIDKEVGEICSPDSVPALAASISKLGQRLSQVSRTEIARRARPYLWVETVKALGNSYA